MANICSIHAEIRCASKEGPARLHEALTRRIEEADRQRIGLYIGSQRYLFDAEAGRDKDSVILDGWVKWSLDCSEASAFVEFLKQLSDVEWLKIEYDECGCLLHGYYLLENGVLTDTYLPEGEFPDDEEDSDGFYDRLDEILEEKGVTCMVGEFTSRRKPA